MDGAEIFLASIPKVLFWSTLTELRPDRRCVPPPDIKKGCRANASLAYPFPASPVSRIGFLVGCSDGGHARTASVASDTVGPTTRYVYIYKRRLPNAPLAYPCWAPSHVSAPLLEAETRPTRDPLSCDNFTLRDGGPDEITFRAS